ncbi:polyphosphate kinase 2 family protein [Vitreimonas flagellata]|uniref:polyphosphate kinase 2 family protein n=1 Tax=Vitreimonas flagellata TaxID=2560861 RepID=UPI001075794C|nr:polyphosphate kinase 2 family protein [Vitreimonas flagellata]
MTHDWKAIDEAVRVEPGKKSKLRARECVGADLLPDREVAEGALKDCAKAIDVLQDRLWAERSRALLVVLQGIDTSGKDGTVRGVFNQCGPLGVSVTAFGKPTEEELAHDYLWRVHAAVPKKGMIGVFNRSHYEDVLVAKVRGLAPKDAIEQRYDQINAFEKHLSENGVTVLKFMLHISKEEQRQRLQERLDKPEKNWKFNAGDLEDRKLWDEYQAAYETLLDRCSTEHAPWRVIPADKKWRRNAIIAAIVHGTLEEMNPRYPVVEWKPTDYVVE